MTIISVNSVPNLLRHVDIAILLGICEPHSLEGINSPVCLFPLRMSSQMQRAHQPDASQGHSYNPLSSYSQHPQSPSIHPSFLSPSAIALLSQSSQESVTRTKTTSTTIFNRFFANYPTYLLQSLATPNPNPHPPSKKLLLQQQSLNDEVLNRLYTLLVHPPGN